MAEVKATFSRVRTQQVKITFTPAGFPVRRDIRATTRATGPAGILTGATLAGGTDIASTAARRAPDAAMGRTFPILRIHPQRLPGSC